MNINLLTNHSLVSYLTLNRYVYSLSMTAAAPIPVPMHIEITPNFPPVLLSSGRRVAICLAPVHPSGCPRAMAPPFGLSFLVSTPSFSTQ